MPKYMVVLSDYMVASLAALGLRAWVRVTRVRGTKCYRVRVEATGCEDLRQSERQRILWCTVEDGLPEGRARQVVSVEMVERGKA